MLPDVIDLTKNRFGVTGDQVCRRPHRIDVALIDAGLRQLLNALELFLQAVARFNEVFRHLQKKAPGCEPRAMKNVIF